MLTLGLLLSMFSESLSLLPLFGAVLARLALSRPNMKRLPKALLFCSIVATTSGACPGGWYHFATSCYAFIDAEPLGWTEAMFYCSTLHAKLVEIGSSVENNFLKSHAWSLHNNESYWIGLTDALVEGKFIWQMTQDGAVFTDWAPSESNDSGHSEDCGSLGFGYHYRWNDAHCSTKYDFICEKELEGDVPNVIG